jgi:hypothetical protein
MPQHDVLAWSSTAQWADMETHTMVDDGARLVVEAWYDVEARRNRARLLIDGEDVDTADTGPIGMIELGKDAGQHVRVVYRWRGAVWRVGLVEKIGSREVFTQFAPPPGSRAARSYAFQQKHPALYASRHIAFNVVATVLAIIGAGALVGALIGGLAPRVDLPGVDIDPPDWVRYVDPWYYMEPLFGWVPDVDLPNLPGVSWLKYVVGFLIAVAIAVEETKRRKKRGAEQRQSSRDENELG